MSAAPDPASPPDRFAPTAEELKILGICALISAVLLIAPKEAVSAAATGVIGAALLYAHVRALRREIGSATSRRAPRTSLTSKGPAAESDAATRLATVSALML